MWSQNNELTTLLLPLLLLQLFYGSLDFIWGNPGEPVPEETFTHPHLSWSSIIPYLLPPSITIHDILPVQLTHLTVFCTISVQVFFGLPHGLVPSTSYSIHFFTQPLSSFLEICHTITAGFAVVPRLCHLILVSLSTLFMQLYLLASCQTSMWSFSSLPAEVPPHFPFLQARSHFHAAYYLAQPLHNLPFTINDTSVLVSNNTNCLYLFHPIRIMDSTAASTSPSTLNMSPQ